LNLVYGCDKDSGLNPPAIQGPLVFFLPAFFWLLEEAGWMAGIFSLARLLWVTEAFFLFAAFMLIIGLQILLIFNPGSWTGLGFEKIQGPDFKFFLEHLAMSLPVGTAPNTFGYAQRKLQSLDFFRLERFLGLIDMILIIEAATLLDFLLRN
jgi:di/tricarboxylate transporter